MGRLTGFRESNIQENRASLSCIKQFVAALEALCERMEINSHASHKLTETVSKRAAHMSTDQPNEEMETSGNDGGAILDKPQASSNEVTDGKEEEGSGTTEFTSSSKRSRISNWLRNVCRRKSSSSLHPVLHLHKSKITPMFNIILQQITFVPIVAQNFMANTTRPCR